MRMLRTPLPLLALLCLSGCPTREPTHRPRAVPFDALQAKRALQARLDRLRRLPSPPPAERAATHRDLGWLLWAHLGAPDQARAAFERAAQVAGTRPHPWVTAGLASLADLRLDVERAATLWAETLSQVAAARQHPETALPTPLGLRRTRLAELAVSRLQEQLRHARAPWPVARLERLYRLDLPPLARAALALQIAHQRRRQGRAQPAQTWQDRAGCLATYRVSRRLGQFPRLDLLRPLRGERQALRGARVRPAVGCRLVLRSADGRAGVQIAEAVVRREHAGPALLQLAWRGPLGVAVNGAPLLDPHTEATPRPILRTLKVSLKKGLNRLRFKVPVSARRRMLHARVVSLGAPLPRPRPRPRGAPRAARRERLLYAPLHWLLQVHHALERGLPDAGREAAAHLATRTPRFSWGRLFAGRLEQADPLQPQSVGQSRARAMYQAGLKSHPGAHRLRLRLAELLRQQSKSKKALQLLTLRKGLPAEARRIMTYARLQLYRDLRWQDLAAREAAALAQRYPGWRAAWKLHLTLARQEHHAAHIRQAARHLHRLDATSLQWARILAQQGELKKALAELDRVARLTTPSRGLAWRATWLEQTGPPAAARKARRDHLEAARWDAERRLALADLLVAQRRPGPARHLLQQGFAAHPEQKDLFWALQVLGAPDPLAPFRVDGAKAVADYEQAHWAPGRRPVYVLDRTVIRVLPSGGRLVLTHQIVHLRTKEALGQFGEVRLPPGARVLTLRTRKKDGSTREPEERSGRRSVSLPDLEVGDYIEAEYVTAAPPAPTWRPGGFYASSFSFRSPQAHFFRSELVMVTPQGLRLQTSRWGAVPKPVVTRRGALRITRYTARRMERLEPEPLSAQLRGPLPTIHIGARVSWPAFLRQRQELLWGLDTASYGVRRLARRLCATGTPEARARRVYGWVQSNVEESGGLYVSASHTLARRSGSRLELLRSLLAECHLGPARLQFLWPRQLEFRPGGLPPFGAYRQPLLALTLAGRTVRLLPQLQQAPFGYLPPMLNGAWAVTLETPDAPPRRTPTRPEAEARETRLRVILRPDGSAVVSGEERLQGLIALQLRAAIRRVPEQKLRQFLERAFFGRYFAGASLTRLVFEHRKNPDQPLILRYRLSVPQLAHPAGSRLAMRAGFYPARVGRVFAALPQRKLPLRLGPLGPHRLVADIELPSGYRLASAPPKQHLKSDWGRFQLRVTMKGNTVHLARELRVPYRVVTPRDYPAFAQWAARVDRAEQPLLLFSK